FGDWPFSKCGWTTTDSEMSGDLPSHRARLIQTRGSRHVTAGTTSKSGYWRILRRHSPTSSVTSPSTTAGYVTSPTRRNGGRRRSPGAEERSSRRFAGLTAVPFKKPIFIERDPAVVEGRLDPSRRSPGVHRHHHHHHHRE